MDTMGDGDSSDSGTNFEDIDFESLDPNPGALDPDKFDLGEDHIEIDTILYPEVSDIKTIHDDIIAEDEDASEGVLDLGSVDFAVEYIKHGHFGEVPETLHEKSFELMRLLAANHGFADGNKRTALNTTWTFYAMNGYYFDYGEEIKAILKLIAVKEEMVDKPEVVSYFSDIAYEADSDRAPTEFVKLQYLNAWKEDIDRRFEELTQGDTDNKEIGRKLGQLTKEQLAATSELVALKNEYEDTLPDEIVEIIEAAEEDGEQFLDFLASILELIRECDTGEEYRERAQNLMESHPYISDPD